MVNMELIVEAVLVVVVVVLVGDATFKVRLMGELRKDGKHIDRNRRDVITNYTQDKRVIIGK